MNLVGNDRWLKNKSILISKLLFFTENNKLIEENLRIADLFYEHDIALGILARSTTINILRSKIPTDYQEKINFWVEMIKIKRLHKAKQRFNYCCNRSS